MVTLSRKQKSNPPAQTPSKSIKRSTSFIAALILAIASLIAPQLTYQQSAATAGAEPLTVTADNQYIDATDGNPSIKTIPTNATKTALATNTTSWDQNNGWYIADSNITLENTRVTITAGTTVNLLLKNNITLSIPKGIELEEGANLNIFAQTENNNEMGKLVIKNVDEEKAGIGTGGSSSSSRSSDTSFTVNIHGGNITTTSGKNSAGIGSGQFMKRGTIKINIHGGNTTANGGNLGAGIGSGPYMIDGTINIKIYGGNIAANGGDLGAGIGSGRWMSGGTIAININGGNTTATGGNSGAGIGSGPYMGKITIGNPDTNKVDIAITGGIINTTGKNGGANLGSGTYAKSTRASVNVALSQGPIIINNDILGETDNSNNTYTNGYGDTFTYEENPVIFTGSFTTELNDTREFTLAQTGTITGNKTLPKSVKFLTEINENGEPQYSSATTFKYVIPASKTLTVAENAYLTIDGQVTNNGTIINNGDVYLTQNGNVANTANITKRATLQAPIIKTFTGTSITLATTSWAQAHGTDAKGTGVEYCISSDNQDWNCNTYGTFNNLTAGQKYYFKQKYSDDPGDFYTARSTSDTIIITGGLNNSYILHNVNNEQLTTTTEQFTNYTPIINNQEDNPTWTDGFYYPIPTTENQQVTINKRVTVTGTVNLVLANNVTLNIPKGIEMTEGATLNIYAQTENNNEMGKLVIDNVDEEKAGIGTKGTDGSEQGSDTSFTVNIHGGNINTTGGKNSAGIGSGTFMQGGTIAININGGNIAANGGDDGAGIGSGAGMDGGTINIKIYGGNTTSHGGVYGGAGIGSGPIMQGGTINIKIYGGNTKTKGGNYGAGIGNGTGMDRGTITININGGIIAANGGDDGAGIGSGTDMGQFSNGTPDTNKVDIAITGGIINTTGGNSGGANLGSGTNTFLDRASVTVALNQGPIIINNDALNSKYNNVERTTPETGAVVFTGSFTTNQPGTKEFTLAQSGTITGNKTLPANVQFLTGINAESEPQYSSATTFKYTIPENNTLTIGKNSTLTNTGNITVNQNGTLENNGELVNTGTITNNWKITGTGTFTNNNCSTVIPFNLTTVTTNIDENRKVTATAESPVTPVEFNFDGDGWGTTASRTYPASDTSLHTVTARINPTTPAWLAQFYAGTAEQSFRVSQEPITSQEGGNFTADYAAGTIQAAQGFELKETTSQNTSEGPITVEQGKTYQIRKQADTVRGLNASAWVDIPPFAFQDSPGVGVQGLTFTNPTNASATNGTITGQTGTSYEYRKVTTPETSNWTQFTDTDTTPTAASLESGDYQVRIKGDTGSQKMPSAPVTISLRHIQLEVTPATISTSYNSDTAHPITVTNKGNDSITITAALTATGEENNNDQFNFTPTQSSILLAPNTSATIGNITPQDAANLSTGDYSIQLQLTLNGKGISPSGETRTETLTYQVANAAQSAPAQPTVTVSEDNKLVITAPADADGKTVLYCVQQVANNIFATTTEHCDSSWMSKEAAEAVTRTPATSYAIWAKYAAVTDKFAQSPASLQQLVTTKPNATVVERDNIDYVHETIQNADKLEFSTSSENFDAHIVSEPNINNLIKTESTAKLFVRVKANLAAGTPASDTVSITLPKRATAPKVDKQDVTYQGLNDGQITGLKQDSEYEYQKQGADTWTGPITGTESIDNLPEGKYLVRITADQEGKQFASAKAPITIGKGLAQNSKLEAQTEIAFNSASYNYPQPTALNAQVTRATGFNTPVTITAASIPEKDESNFTFTKHTNLTSGTITVTTSSSGAITVGAIQPKQGLTAGVYTTKITVTYQATEGTDTKPKTVDIPVSFTVTEATQDAPALESSNVAVSETSITITDVANNIVSGQPARYCVLPAEENTDETACTGKWTSNSNIQAEAATSYKVFAIYPAVASKYADSEVSTGVLVTTPVTANTVLAENINYPAETLTVPTGSKLEFATSRDGFDNKETQLANGAYLTSIIDNADRVVYARVKAATGLPASTATTVQLPARPTLNDLTTVAATSSNNQDGQINGLNPSYGYIYQKQGDQHWFNHQQPSATITGLAAGTYLVTIPAGPNSFAAKQPATLTITAATTTIGQLQVQHVTDTSITVTPITADPATGAKAEYSKDNGATWQESNTFTGLDAATKYEITARYTGQPASGTTTTTATTNNAAPTTKQINGGSGEGTGSGDGSGNQGEGTGSENTGVINHGNGTLNTKNKDNLEFATSKDFNKNSILPTGSNLEDLAGQTIYVRTKENPETGAAASTPIEIKIPEKAATPNLGVTGDGKITGLTEGQGYQISTGTDPATSNWTNLDPATQLTPGVYQIRQSGSSKDNTLPSAPTTLIVTSPIGEVTIEKVDEKSITITPIPADQATGAKAEYSIDGGNTWQESNTFTGLEPASKHQVAIRYQMHAGTTGITNTATVSATTAAATPDANSLIDFTNQMLNPASGSGAQDQAAVEYATSKDFTPNTILAEKQDLRQLAGQTIYARTKANPTAGIPASNPVEVKVPVVAATPQATVGENGLVSGLNPNLTYEYQPKPANMENSDAAPASGWITIPAGTTELKLAAGTYLLRVKADQNNSMFASETQELTVPETTTPVVIPPVVNSKDTGDDTGAAVAFTSMILALVFSLLAIPAFALATKLVVIPGVNDR